LDYQQLLDLEKVKQSEFSPCVISNEEVVCRAIFTPNHYKNGKIQPAAFEQIFSSSGMSILRKYYSFSKSLEKTIEIIETNEKKFVTCTSALVSDIRNILCEKRRLVCVIDTAREDRIAHADLLSTRKYVDCKLEPRSMNLLLRREVSKVFNCA